MNSPATCQKCGVPISQGVEFSFCPQCLIREAQSDSKASGLAETQDSNSSAGARFHVPSAEDLDSLLTGIEVTELIGHGGMGAVYRGRQISLDREVAIKILPREIQESGHLSERFQREAQTLAKLHHPNIVSVFDFGEVEGLHYIVMEFVEGITLRDAIQSKTMNPAAALETIPVICDALQFAHSHGVVHRDIKPENILLDEAGQVKIADFGLAKMLNRDDAAKQMELTGTQQIMGTARYMAPEQMSTSKTVDHRADIYSLGVVFYELLTGEPPMGWFQPPSKKVAVDVRLDEVVLRTLESEPSRRYQQASEVRTAIEGLSSPAESSATSASEKSPVSTTQSVRLHKLLDSTESYYRKLHSWSTMIGFGLIPVSVVVYRASATAGIILAAAALAAIIYSVRIKRHQVFEAEYKGHTIRLDNSGTFAERLYLDDGLVKTGGLGMKMEFRFPIKAGEGIGDEIIVWFDAGFFSTRCRIDVESKSG